MWQIENRTPFAVGQGWVRDQNGAETWLVVVKATFDILPGEATEIAKEQPPVTRSPKYRGEPGQSSIQYENDFVLAKNTTDVVLNGKAYAPRGVATPVVDVGMQVGPVTKVLRVFGDRVWGSGGAWLSTPLAFTSMPLVYERAFGGVDPQSPRPDVDWYWPNPVGTGFVASRAHADGVRVPNVEYVDQLISAWDARPVPAGLGVIGSHWQERAAFTGTYDAAWSNQRAPLPPLDFDVRHHQSVPKDQQAPAFLRGGEPVLLANMTPSGALRFTLPAIELAMETFFQDEERREHPAPRLHTVILEPDFPRVSLLWHSAIECHAKVYQLERTRVQLKKKNLPEKLGEDEGEDDEEVGSLLDLL